MKIELGLLFFSLLIALSCISSEKISKEPIGFALIDGITKDGESYDVNIWQATDPNRGKIVTSLSPNTKIKIFVISLIDEIPWFEIETETGLQGWVNILHLKDIQVKKEQLEKYSIDYKRIQTLSMMPDNLIKRKMIQSY